ncbi:MAG: electron transfer flavoprotein subunit alpha/FixB family protein [Bdellovibrionales bacterium]|nr:electron transfer flavoprotein subunit alpha/FixB family protein [Bdellovibrionales bacterium]
MPRTLVFCEYDNLGIKKGTQELLTLVQKIHIDSFALLLGNNGFNFAPLIEQLGTFGVKNVFVCQNEILKYYNPESFTQALNLTVESCKPELILASSSMMAKDLFPRLAAKIKTGVVSDCNSLEITTEKVVVTRPLYSGKCTAQVDFLNSPIKVVLMRANQLPIEKAQTPSSPKVNTLSLPPLDLKTTVKSIVQGTVGKVDLTEANIIVSGGRGLGGPQNFKLLEDLASVLGGAVGASRAVADAGWVPHSLQVGQTGKTVSPTLYIACGISGAIQHLAGMSGSKVIVAINKDPEAPIFKKATYGIVGDLFEVVPLLTEEFRRILT